MMDNTSLQAAMSALQKEMRHAGLKLTRQRETIARVFFAQKEHMRAEEVLQLVRKFDPQVSLATVYRTLKVLQVYGFAKSHHFGDGQARFEPNVLGETHHDHLICTVCGNIEEFYDSEIERLQEVVALAHRFQVMHHKMELYGKCERCI